MATPSYSDTTVRRDLMDVIGVSYANDAKLMQTPLVEMGAPGDLTGVSIYWATRKIFQDSQAGQAIGISTNLDADTKVFSDYKMPIIQRGRAVNLDQIQNDILGRNDSDADLVQAISEASAQYLNYSMVKHANGVGLFLENEGTNINDTGATVLAFGDIADTMAKRGEYGNRSKIIMTHSAVYWHYVSLGFVTYANATIDEAKRADIVTRGDIGTIVGAFFYTDDNIVTNGSDYYALICEPNSLMVRLNTTPYIKMVSSTDTIGEKVQFYNRFALKFKNIAWTASDSDIITDTDLATLGNYELAESDVKYVPMTVLRGPLA